MLLPEPTSTDFPAALKAARQKAGLSRSALARAAGIHTVMPRRYEEPEARDFARPTPATKEALEKALVSMPAQTTLREERRTEEKEQAQAVLGGPLLLDASIDEIVAELRKRGISVSLTFPA